MITFVGWFKWFISPRSMEAEGHHDANFVIIGGTTGCCHDENLWCHQWWQSWHHVDSQILVVASLTIAKFEIYTQFCCTLFCFVYNNSAEGIQMINIPTFFKVASLLDKQIICCFTRLVLIFFSENIKNIFAFLSFHNIEMVQPEEILPCGRGLGCPS